MSGIETAMLSAGMQKNTEQNVITQMQASAREGKIPQIAEISTDSREIQDSLSQKLTDSGEPNKFQPERMQENIEQNMITQMQASAREGKIPQIAELNKENAHVQDSLAGKLTDAGEPKMLVPEGKMRKELSDAYRSELRDVVSEGKISDIDTNTLRGCSSEENAVKRFDFNENKRGIISDWETKNGSSWPKYMEDVYDEKTGTDMPQ